MLNDCIPIWRQAAPGRLQPFSDYEFPIPESMNCTISEYLFAAMAAVYVGSSLVGSWQGAALASMLRLRHPATWKRLGGADGISNSDDTGHALALMAFLWHREYQNLGDSEVLAKCERSRRFMVLGFVTVASTLVCLVATPSLERALLFQCWRPL